MSLMIAIANLTSKKDSEVSLPRKSNPKTTEPEWTDQKLLETMRNGGPKAQAAFDCFYHKHFNRFVRVCRYNTGVSEETAQIAVNETLTHIWTVYAVKKIALVDRKGAPVANVFSYLMTKCLHEARKEAMFESGMTKDRQKYIRVKEREIEHLEWQIQDLEQEGTPEALQAVAGLKMMIFNYEREIAKRSRMIFMPHKTGFGDMDENIRTITIEGMEFKNAWQTTDPPTPHEEARAHEVREILHNCIETLPPEMKNLYRWVYEEKRSQRAIAGEWGVALGTVNARVEALHQTLRNSLEKMGFSLNDFLG